jgi:hypothetical protein
MFKKILLVLGFSLLTSSAFAACTNPLPILNGSSGTVNMSVSQNTADAGCMYNITPNQGGAPLSATNGWWTNILQGNAALSATNGLYANILQGNAANSAANPFFFAPATSSVWPVSVASLPLPSGAATSALQGTNTATTAHTCSVSGFSEIGCLGQIDDDVKGAIAAGGNTIGNTGSDPSSGKGTPASAPINVSTATTTQIVALSGSTAIYVTSFDVMAGGTGNITFEYGTGTACATGTTVLTGAYPLTAQAGIAKGSGVGTLLKVPSGNALCVLTSAAVQYSGSVSYQQF